MSHMLALLTTFFLALIVAPFLSLTPVARLPSKVTWSTWAFSSILPPCFFTPLHKAIDDRQHQNSGVAECLAGWQLCCTQLYHSHTKQGGALHVREGVIRQCKEISCAEVPTILAQIIKHAGALPTQQDTA